MVLIRRAPLVLLLISAVLGDVPSSPRIAGARGLSDTASSSRATAGTFEAVVAASCTPSWRRRPAHGARLVAAERRREVDGSLRVGADLALRLRGGAKKKTKRKTAAAAKTKKKTSSSSPADDDSDSGDSDDEDLVLDDESSDEEVDWDDLDFDDDGASMADFEGEDTLMRRIKSAVERTPPITQGFLSLSILVTFLAMLMNGNEYPKFLLLDWQQVFSRFQIWRLFTAFLYFGPFDISFVLTIQFVWQYMSQLEKVHHKEPEQFVMMWVTGASFLLVAFLLSNIPTANLGHNLSCYLVYVWARTYEGHDINFMELFTMRSELMPWFLALQTFLLEGEFPLMDLVGIAVGHIYYVLYSAKVLPVPEFLTNFFRGNEFLKARYDAVADDFEVA